MCEWTDWYDVDDNNDGSDNETYENIEQHGHWICKKPNDIECKAKGYLGTELDDFMAMTGQKVHCDLSFGLMCHQKEQTRAPYKCYDYKIRVECCVPCEDTTTTTSTTTTTQPSSTTMFMFMFICLAQMF